MSIMPKFRGIRLSGELRLSREEQGSSGGIRRNQEMIKKRNQEMTQVQGLPWWSRG